jgi:alpha-glucosidase
VYYGGDRGTTGHYPDLGRSQVRRWWGTQYQKLFDMGLEMVWQDMTTPAIRDTRGDMRGLPFRLQLTDDFLSNVPPQQNQAIRVWNLYSYNLHKATYHGLNALRGRENKRNFIVGRGSFTGMHRFAALWTGDNASTWSFLQINVAQVLALGMCGIAICGEDIGGFEAEFDWQRWVDPELLMRWTIVGAFLPWFRNHYIRKGRKLFQEPFRFSSVDLSKVFPVESRKYYGMVLPVCRMYIERRYRLLQLFYDAMWENTLNGMPICRSMILTDAKDKALYNDKIDFLGRQFMVRNDLLLAPILEPESDVNAGGRRDVYLPSGSAWYCYMDNRLPLGAPVEGGTTVRGFDAGLYMDGVHEAFLLPTYVRAGAIVPTIEIEQFIGERGRNGQSNPITLNVYPGANGEYRMYLDDGVSRSSAPKRDENEGGDPAARGQYRELLITHTLGSGTARTIRMERVLDGFQPPFEKFYFVAVLLDPSASPPSTIRIGGTALQQITDGTPEARANSLASSGSNMWFYNENTRIAFVKVFDQPEPIVVEVI